MNTADEAPLTPFQKRALDAFVRIIVSNKRLVKTVDLEAICNYLKSGPLQGLPYEPLDVAPIFNMLVDAGAEIEAAHETLLLASDRLGVQMQLPRETLALTLPEQSRLLLEFKSRGGTSGLTHPSAEISVDVEPAQSRPWHRSPLLRTLAIGASVCAFAFVGFRLNAELVSPYKDVSFTPSLLTLPCARMTFAGTVGKCFLPAKTYQAIPLKERVQKAEATRTSLAAQGVSRLVVQAEEDGRLLGSFDGTVRPKAEARAQ